MTGDRNAPGGELRPDVCSRVRSPDPLKAITSRIRYVRSSRKKAVTWLVLPAAKALRPMHSSERLLSRHEATSREARRNSAATVAESMGQPPAHWDAVEVVFPVLQYYFNTAELGAVAGRLETADTTTRGESPDGYYFP